MTWWQILLAWCAASCVTAPLAGRRLAAASAHHPPAVAVEEAERILRESA